MKYLPLVWAGIWRKRSRAVLMLLQIAVAFTLFGLLQGLNSGIKEAIARTHGDRLYVGSSVSLGDPLPIGLQSRIQTLPGVLYVSPSGGIPANYQKPGQGVPINGVDAGSYFSIYNEFQVEKQAIEALRNTRDGAIVGVPFMTKYGWKVGQHIMLQSPVIKKDGSGDWSFNIVGVFDASGGLTNANVLIANYGYVNEARASGRDRANVFVARIDSPANAPSIALAIDNAFANSDHETRTQSEGDLVASQIQRIADLDYIVGGIIGAVFFALLLATGALMMQSTRERTPELGVLKTLGYPDVLVMTLLLLEAVTFCVFSAGIGLFIASRLLPLARQQIGIAGMPFIVVLAGVGFAVLLGLLGGAAPAWRALKLQVADALADR